MRKNYPPLFSGEGVNFYAFISRQIALEVTADDVQHLGDVLGITRLDSG